MITQTDLGVLRGVDPQAAGFGHGEDARCTATSVLEESDESISLQATHAQEQTRCRVRAIRSPTTRHTGDHRVRFRRPLVALGAALTALVLASSALAAFQSLPAAGGQVNDDPANGIDPNRTRASPMSSAAAWPPAAAGAVGHVRAEDRLLTADLRPCLQERRLGDAGLPGVAQHRPDEGGRGSGHRLRRRRPERALGVLVRAERPSGRQPHEHLRKPLRLDVEPVAAVRR